MTDMTAQKHTEGPWIAAPYSSVVGAPVVSASGRPVARVTYFNLGDGFENHDNESAANARLIAAAPELLEALRDCLNRFVEAFPAASEYEPIKRGFAAIAKAEGA